MKRLLLYILMIISIPVFSQNSPIKSRDIMTSHTDSIHSDSLEGKPSWFKRVIGRFFDFSAYDTTYIEPNHYNYALMSNYVGNYESYKFSSKFPTESIEFAPNVTTRVGLYFGWRWLFLGYTIDSGELFHNQPKNRNTEFVLSLYSSKIGVDLYYRKTGNDFKIKSVNGFNDVSNIKSYNNSDFDGLRASMKGINLYYIWNNNHFSYPAAYSQSTNQKISCGSWIAGLSYSEHNIDFDITKLPWYSSESSLALEFTKVDYIDVNFNMGYSYNWVFAKNCLFNISFTPALAYKKSRVAIWDGNSNEEARAKGDINFDILGRSSFIYNTGKYYFGALATLHGFNYKQSSFEMFNMFTNFQVYLGFNFNLKKEYRKRH